MELHGDRKSGDDHAVLGGLASLDKYKVVVIGYGGSDSSGISRIPSSEGYRKGIRLLSIAQAFKKPVIVFIDIPETDPKPSPQQQKIDEAIAHTLGVISSLETSVISLITGKSNSAIAIDMCVADRVLILEDATCRVPSLLKAQDLLNLNLVDRIVKYDDLDKVILEELCQLSQISPYDLAHERLNKSLSRFVNFEFLS